jgi:hypothetical protein
LVDPLVGYAIDRFAVDPLRSAFADPEVKADNARMVELAKRQLERIQATKGR